MAFLRIVPVIALFSLVNCGDGGEDLRLPETRLIDVDGASNYS